MTPTSLLTAKGVGKRFGALTALSDIDIEIRGGEVLALVGDNGAGKSTFIKILAGAHRAEPRASSRSRERPVTFASPQDAAAAGIATIFQELALSENLTDLRERLPRPRTRPPDCSAFPSFAAPR